MEGHYFALVLAVLRQRRTYLTFITLLVTELQSAQQQFFLHPAMCDINNIKSHFRFHNSQYYKTLTANIFCEGCYL